jgi:hypothetical protein
MGIKKPSAGRDAERARRAAMKSGVSSPEIPPESPVDDSIRLASVPLDPYAHQCALVDLNLLSGSSERMRNSLGGHFVTEIDDRGLLPVPPRFVTFNPFYNAHPDIGSIQTFSSNDAVFSNTALQRGFGENYSSLQQTVVPSNSFVCRIEGDPSRSPNLENVLNASKYWEVLFTGGNYLDSYMLPMYNTGTYDDHYTVIRTPYKAIERNYLKGYTGVTETIEATYEYNRYFRKYQNFASQIDNERKLPNFYVYNIMGLLPYIVRGGDQPEKSDGGYRSAAGMLSLEGRAKAKTLVEDYNYQYYTFGERLSLYELDSYVTTFNEVDEASGNIITKKTPSHMLPSTEYINEIIPANYDFIEPTVLNKFDEKNKNLIFGADSTRLMLNRESEFKETAPSWPYYNKINVSLNASNLLYRSIIQSEDNDTSALVMRTIKEVFLEQTDLVPLQHMDFQKTSLYMSGTLGSTEDMPSTNNEMVTYKSADFVRMLLYAYQNVLMEHEDFQIVGPSTINSRAVADTRGLYRALNSKNLAKLLNEVLDLFGTVDSATKITNVSSLFNSQESDIPKLEDIDTLNAAPKYNEIIGFRVEKIGGDVQGDSNSQQVLQNFWIFNDSSMNAFDLLDSQVKYNTDYTYKVYAYYLVKGYKYKYSNLQLSRIVGQVRQDGYAGPLEMASGLAGGPPEPPLAYCVEYYDPYTQDTSDDFLENTPSMTQVDMETIDLMSSVSTDAQRIAASSYTDEDGKVLPPYVANFQMTVQPSLRLIQVPYIEKTYRVMDHPPNQIDVTPGYTLLNDNTITFNLAYQGHSPLPYPRPITENDISNEMHYLKANDILDTTRVQDSSVSPQRFVEVYCLPHKPESFRDFENVTPKLIELEVEGTEFSYTTAIFNDIIKSNHKYYYLFRVINTNGVAGNVNTIIEAELVNDGGYKYGTFEVLFEEDLVKEDFDKSTTSFKNIFQLKPNMNQLTLNTEASNYDKRAREEYENVKVGSANDLIWGKTFKIRLTSKKTGKKIDLNITYSDPDINLPRN